jgi:hypothetical protein
MERITGGEPKSRKALEARFKVYPEFDIDNLPCLCDNPNVRIMKRGKGTHAIFWADCESCGRQWQPALNLDVAISYFVFAMVSNKDPYEFKVRKKRRPKVKLPKKIQPEEEE